MVQCLAKFSSCRSPPAPHLTLCHQSHGVLRARGHGHHTLLLELRGELQKPAPAPNFVTAQPTVAMPGTPVMTRKPTPPALDEDGASLL